MNQKLSGWASIAEIVSGIAVVITLVFLVLGLRDNADLTRVMIYSDMIDSINDQQQVLVTDPELNRLWYAFLNNEFDAFDDSEKLLVETMHLILLRTYEKAFFSQAYGVMDGPEWERFAFNICSMAGRGVSFGLDLANHTSLTQDFRDFMIEDCGLR